MATQSRYAPDTGLEKPSPVVGQFTLQNPTTNSPAAVAPAPVVEPAKTPRYAAPAPVVDSNAAANNAAVKAKLEADRVANGLNPDGTAKVVVPTTPAGPTTPVVTPPATDYSGIPAVPIPSMADFTAERNKYLAVDENAIREQIRQQQQARIDAINALYDTRIAQEKVAGEGRLGETRAIGARSGLLGSDFGAAQKQKTVQLNASQEAAINAEREMKIQGVFDKIDELTQNKVQAQKAEALGNLNAFNEYKDKANASTQAVLQTLGKQGVTYEKLKEQAPDKLKSLIDASGKSELEVALILNSSHPDPIKYDWQKIGNSIVGIGVDPTTNKPVKTVFTATDLGLPDSANLDFQTAGDGQVYYYDKDNPSRDADGNIVLQKVGGPKVQTKVIKGAIFTSEDGGKTWLREAPGGTPTPTRPLTPTEKAAKANFTNKLNAVAGADTFVSPQDYLKFRNEWEDAGYNATAYDAFFKGYKNPNNPNYTTNKQKSTSKSGRTI